MSRARIIKKQAAAQSSKSFRSEDSFTNFQARLGTGNPATNQSALSGYGIDHISRNRQLLENAYRSSWICGVAVDCVAEDMTKRGIEIVTTADPGDVEALQANWSDIELWDQICTTIKWGRLYGGALGILLIDGQKLDTPLRIETVGKGAFKGLYSVDRWMAQPDLSSAGLVREFGPDFGKPAFYSINADATNVLAGQRVHYTRVVRIDGVDLPFQQRQSENLWGQSVLERLWDRLLAFDSTTQGAAQLVFKAHLRTYSIEGLRELIAAGGPFMDALAKQIEFTRFCQSNEGMTLMDAKDKFEAHTYTFAGLDTVLLQFAQQLAGALQIPLVRLFGQSQAGLNSTGESDIRNYYDGIGQQQQHRLRSPLSRILHVSWRSCFGVAMPPGSGFTFRPLWVMSDTEKATIAKTIGESVTQVEGAGIVKRATALKELRQSAHTTGIWSNISDEEIQEAEEEPPPAPEGIAPPQPDGENDVEEPDHAAAQAA